MAGVTIGGLNITNPLALSSNSGGSSAKSAAAPADNGVFWQGADGNVYVKGSQGTNAAGAFNGDTSNYWTGKGYSQIADPNAPAGSTNTNSNNTANNSSTASTATLSPAAIAAAIAAMVNQQQTEQNQYNSAQSGNAASDAQQAADEQLQVQNNTGARANAIQNAEQAAATGNQGLKAVLASLGALGGTGQILAGRAVADSANNNIGSADSTYTTNNQNIAAADAAYQTQKGARDQALQQALNTDQQNTSNSTYQNLINQAENIGDTNAVSQFLPKLVASTAPITPIGANPVIYNGANVGAYAPASSVNVTSAPSTPGAAASQTAAENAVTPVNSALYVNKTS